MRELRSPIYLIINYSSRDRDAALSLLDAGLAGGVGMIQFRAKQPLAALDLDCLATMLERARAADVALVVNDRVDLARTAGADGVHVGLEDASVAAARGALGPNAIVGATTPTPELALAAERDGASYVAVGSVHPSPTRPDKPVVGVERVRAVAAVVRVPVCAIGGITAARVPELLAAGAGLLCVISAVTEAPEPTEVVRELVAACRPRGR
jgi:thiamine-phosphate pyrophosphorylase